MSKFILAGDIGGTKTLLQLAACREGGIFVEREQYFDSAAYADFDALLRDFLQTDKKKIGQACFAVAGPISHLHQAQRASLTNLPWQLDSAAIAAKFALPQVKLINDFEAVALALADKAALPAGDLLTLQAGEEMPQGASVVLGAGTGLGVAWLNWHETRSPPQYLPQTSEAGHMDFAPADELQAALLVYLRQKFGHVSYERIVSGAGLVEIFVFLQSRLGEDTGLVQVTLNSDGAARVAELAQHRKHPIAAKALDMFVEIYGAFAGNLALAGMTRGGVYIAGGIAPKIIGTLQQGGFMRAFQDKGRFAPLMREIPVKVVMNPKVGLLGATREAARLADAA